MNSPLMIVEYSRGMMIESIMHLHGCGQPNPLAFRRWLQGLSYEELEKEYHKAMGFEEGE